jgi:methyl coenzyme M reductase subunit D
MFILSLPLSLELKDCRAGRKTENNQSMHALQINLFPNEIYFCFSTNKCLIHQITSFCRAYIIRTSHPSVLNYGAKRLMEVTHVSQRLAETVFSVEIKRYSYQLKHYY